MLSIGTIMRNLGSRFKEGVDPNQLLNFAEAISGEKIHADTRRKLDSFIEQTQKNGGKMSGADMLKMSSMLAGTEHMGKLLAVMLGDWDAMAEKMDNVHGTAKDMANIQLDNLAGDITILGSAWDAFQQDLVEGSAAEGLRSFVQTLTEMISNAQNLFKDGIQIGDFGKIIFDVVDRLRSKFMELDGIGSILAGGVLMCRDLPKRFRKLRPKLHAENVKWAAKLGKKRQPVSKTNSSTRLIQNLAFQARSRIRRHSTPHRIFINNSNSS